MKYTVTIKDNESGEIVREVECNSIVAGVSINEESSASIGIADCEGRELLGACESAKKAIYRVLEDDPTLQILFTLFEMKMNIEMRDKLNKEIEKEDSEND